MNNKEPNQFDTTAEEQNSKENSGKQHDIVAD